MSDRVFASISIGGNVPLTLRAEFLALIEAEGLCMECDEAAFTADRIEPGKPLDLMAHEVPWGCFDKLERFCLQHRLAYARSSASCPGSFGAERIVYTGTHCPLCFDTNDNDEPVLTQESVEHLETLEAIMAYFADAAFTIPPLTFGSR